MIAAYYLVLVFNGFYSSGISDHAIEKIPMQSLEACMTAKNLVLDNQIADKAICVPTGEK